VTSIATLRKRPSGTLERVMASPIAKANLLSAFGGSRDRVAAPPSATCGLLRMTNRAGASSIDGVHRSALSHPGPALVDVELDCYPFARIREALSATAWERLERACEDARELLAGRTLWSINSTARGGGIAEMQRTLWPYWRDAGLDARWLVLSGPLPSSV
jgi:hypothetical protein